MADDAPFKVGEKVPDFTARLATATSFEEFRLSRELGAGPLVIAWFPLAFTGVCTAQLCEVRDTLGTFQELDARVFGASIDTPHTNRAYIQKERLPFPILCDPNRELVGRFGILADEVVGVKNVAKRSVFVIDGDGILVYRWVTDDPEVRPDFDEVRQAIRKARGA